ncbi:MAG TPA: hypothetical protein VHI99_03830 [Vicinamibacterales bacterium]|jgi:hypothetical protein|nr:hypothetical protein [Vicinamibacterales bacterium]
MTVNVEQRVDFFSVLAAPGRSSDIPESADVYGWLCGSWDLAVLHYRGINVTARGMKAEVHAARVLEGRAVQDVWIMPRREDRDGYSDRTMNMFGTTLRSWDAAIQAWRIAWTNPASGHREEQVGRWSGPDILQEGTRADGTKTRWTFTEITADSFHWRGEALYPGKETWVLEGEFLAQRRPS